jgi:phosphoesterase RecJ-like protein
MALAAADKRVEALSELAGVIAGARRILLAAHTSPDGDALGAMLALGQGLEAVGKTATLFCRGPIPAMYDFLPGLDQIREEAGRPEDYDVVLLLDCHEPDRAGLDESIWLGRPNLYVLDHHRTDQATPPGVIDVTASAAGELVWRLLKLLDVPFTESMAVNLFVAISTDTGSFSYSNTSAAALAIAAEMVELGASPWEVTSRLHLNRPSCRLDLLGLALGGLEFIYDGRVGVMTVTRDMLAQTGCDLDDTEGFVEYPRSVAGIELALLFKEKKGETKVSLRSVGRVDAAALARKFGGGGHFQAAGFSLAEPLDQVRRRLADAVGDVLPRREG